MSLEDDRIENGSIGDSADILKEDSIGSEGQEDEEDDDVDDSEPRLKFSRIQNDLLKILEKDAVSCVAVHSKFLCVGSHRGEAYILDHLGNNVTPHPKGSFPAHKVAVNCISIDKDGENIATCSDDGRVNVYNLCDGRCDALLKVDKKIRCVAIDPYYSKHKRFITGDDSVTLHQPNVFGLLKSSPLLEGGIVSSVKWGGDRFIAWNWKDEVRVYDMIENMMISRIKFEWQPNHFSLEGSADGSITRNDDYVINMLHNRYPCHIFWKDQFTLFIGWADVVQICQVTEPRKHDVANGTLSHYVVILSMVTTDFWCCGLSSFGDLITALTLEKDQLSDTYCIGEDAFAKYLPNLQILEQDFKSYNVVQTNALRTRGYQEYKPSDYHLECLIDEILFFIVTPKDIILASARDQDDHVQWLMEHEKYEEALEFASQNERFLRRHTVMKVGTEFLEHLLASERYSEAGKLCFRLFGRENVETWESLVIRFGKFGRLRDIAPYMPRGETSRLSPCMYEMVLYDYLQNHDAEAFLGLVREWAPPPELYNIPTIVNATVEKSLIILHTDGVASPTLLQALADLYSYQKEYGKALTMYLKLQDPQVFTLIQKHGLFQEIISENAKNKESNNIEDLMHINLDVAVNLFLKHKENLSPSVIVQRLQSNRYYQYKYLDSLYKAEGKDMRHEFHGMMVSLYADYEPTYLIRFLKSSDSYPMQEALNICKEREMYPEMIFLLGRMGNTKEALRLITNVLEDIHQAIDFCKEYDDEELWNNLIEFALDKPSCINMLLCNIGTHVDPRILIKRIDDRMEIPGLRDCLVKIMQDYSLQVELQEGCKNILVGDCLVLFQKLVKTQSHGVYVDEVQKCGSCHKQVVVQDSGYGEDVVVFYCNHVFHDACILSFDYQFHHCENPKNLDA
ncbi:unnamed protein product [Orchesella dallaii]|uniref:Vps41 beta-propeller domain-containing protein n=1 Tax=Orchesella dallaii TaxID=48710 RepID=A0ABP1QEW0_9HEXA